MGTRKATSCLLDGCHPGKAIRISRNSADPSQTGPYPHLADNIIAAVVYGDQTRVPGPGYNIGSGGQQCHGRWPRKNQDRCVPSFPYQSYCDIGDPECCVGPNTHGKIHFGYPDKYDAAATQFVMGAFSDSKE